jgi:hypothetical protein
LSTDLKIEKENNVSLSWSHILVLLECGESIIYHFTMPTPGERLMDRMKAAGFAFDLSATASQSSPMPPDASIDSDDDSASSDESYGEAVQGSSKSNGGASNSRYYSSNNTLETTEMTPHLTPVSTSEAMDTIRQAMQDMKGGPSMPLRVEPPRFISASEAQSQNATTIDPPRFISASEYRQKTFAVEPPRFISASQARQEQQQQQASVKRSIQSFIEPPRFISASEDRARTALAASNAVTPWPHQVPPPLFISASEYKQRIEHERAQQPWYRNLDPFLETYVQFMKTPVHQDQTLKLLQYILWFTSRFYLFQQGRQSLLKFSYDISFARMALRLLGGPVALQAYRTNGWALHSHKYGNVYKVLGKILAGSMVGYYPAEGLAYMHWMMPQWLARGRSAEVLSSWSCRCWVAYICAETCQNVLQWKECHEQETTCGITTKTHKRSQIELQLARNALFILPAIHWSLPEWDVKPWLNTNLVNGLMLGESLVHLYQSIQQFQYMQTHGDDNSVESDYDTDSDDDE